MCGNPRGTVYGIYFSVNGPGGPSVANNSAAFGLGGPRGGGTNYRATVPLASSALHYFVYNERHLLFLIV